MNHQIYFGEVIQFDSDYITWNFPAICFNAYKNYIQMNRNFQKIWDNTTQPPTPYSSEKRRSTNDKSSL